MRIIKYFFFVIILFFFGCSDLLVNEPQTNKNLQDFDKVHSIAKRVYPFFEFKKINWDSLCAKYRLEAETTNGDEIYNVIFTLLSQLKDGHIQIEFEGGYPISTYIPIRYKDRKSFNPSIVRRYFSQELKLAGEEHIAYGTTINNIGYIHLPTFHEGNWVKDIGNVISYLSETKGLIIDIRNNPGGSSKSTDYIISHLIDKSIEYSSYSNISEEKYMIEPAKTLTYLKQIVILINGASASAAELFPELLRQLPNVILVGDTTAGAGGALDTYNLVSGKKIVIPVKYFKRLDGTMVEWNGVLPDILVEQTEKDIQNKTDKQLEYAINYLNN